VPNAPRPVGLPGSLVLPSDRRRDRHRDSRWWIKLCDDALLPVLLKRTAAQRVAKRERSDGWRSAPTDRPRMAGRAITRWATPLSHAVSRTTYGHPTWAGQPLSGRSAGRLGHQESQADGSWCRIARPPTRGRGWVLDIVRDWRASCQPGRSGGRLVEPFRDVERQAARCGERSLVVGCRCRVGRRRRRWASQRG
jgi:hypothetical protein